MIMIEKASRRQTGSAASGIRERKRDAFLTSPCSLPDPTRRLPAFSILHRQRTWNWLGLFIFLEFFNLKCQLSSPSIPGIRLKVEDFALSTYRLAFQMHGQSETKEGGFFFPHRRGWMLSPNCLYIKKIAHFLLFNFFLPWYPVLAALV